MKKRSPVAVFLLPFVTFGIYSIYWFVVTKGEMNSKGASIPTAWLIIVPFVNIWWLWKWSEGVGVVTHDKLSAGLAFVLTFGLGLLGLQMAGQAIVQASFNEVSDAAFAPVAAAAPVSPVEQAAPATSEAPAPTPAATTPTAPAAPQDVTPPQPPANPQPPVVS